MAKKNYEVAINTDRVHICTSEGVPVETHLFRSFADASDYIGLDDGKQIAVGVAVLKAMEINKGSVVVKDKTR